MVVPRRMRIQQIAKVSFADFGLKKKKKSKPSNELLAEDLLILFSASWMTFSSVSSSSLEMGMGVFMSITDEAQDDTSMSIIEEERVEDPIAETLSATCVGSVSARRWSKIIIGGEEKDLRSLSIMTLALRGFLRSAVKDLTVFKAFCLALRPTFLTASERDDRDLSEVTDGERLCFRLAMFARKRRIFC